jgi:hypothetical protein
MQSKSEGNAIRNEIIIAQDPVTLSNPITFFGGSAATHEARLKEIRDIMIKIRLIQRRCDTFQYPHASPEANEFNSLTVQQLHERQTALNVTLRDKAKDIDTATFRKLMGDAQKECAELHNNAAAADTISVVVDTYAAIASSRM